MIPKNDSPYSTDKEDRNFTSTTMLHLFDQNCHYILITTE